MLDNEISNKFLSLKLILSNISNTTEKILNILSDSNNSENDDINKEKIPHHSYDITRLLLAHLPTISSSLSAITVILTCIVIISSVSLVFSAIKYFL